MRNRREAKRACELFEVLQIEAAARPLTEREQAFLESHAASCPDCGLVEHALGAMAHDPLEPAFPPMDDISRHRQVEAVLQAFRESELTPPSRFWTRRHTIAAAAALAAAACLAAVVVFRPRRAPHSHRRTLPPPPASLTESPRLLLAAGRVRIEERPASAGLPVPVGRRLTVASGRAALAFVRGSRVLLAGKSRVRIVRSTGRDVTLALAEGSLFAQVTRRPAGGSFDVLAGPWRVSVVGTAFSVTRHGDNLTVRVVRGRVMVTSRTGTRTLVPAGHALVATGPDMFRVSKMQDTSYEDALQRVLALLADSPNSGRLTVRADSETGSVLLDGTVLGETPLQALLRPGKRRLDIAVAGRTVAAETLDVPAGSHLDRSYRFLAAPQPAADTLSSQVASRKPTIQTGLAIPGVPAARRARAATSLQSTPTPPPSPAGRSSSTPSAVPSQPASGASKPKENASSSAGARAQPEPPRSVAVAPTHLPPSPGSASPAPRQPARAKPQPPQPSPAALLLRRARSARAAGRYEQAARLYAAILARHPGTQEALVARISLGHLELGPLRRPHRALEHFRGYLRRRPQGSLAPEALFGLARALRALGRRKAEIETLRRLVAKYPETPQARAAAARLASLRGGRKSP